MPNPDLIVLRAVLKEVVEDNLRGLLEGTQEDLALYAEKIATDVTLATSVPDDERRNALLRELLGQVQAIAEINRLRAVAGAWDIFNTVLRATVKTAVRIVLAL